MTDSLLDLEKRRSEVLAEISALGDFRPGSISATGGRCGTPTCHCHQPDDPGHGPNFRLTGPLRRAFPILRRSVKPNAKSPVSARIRN
jgi:hypothetical protein